MTQLKVFILDPIVGVLVDHIRSCPDYVCMSLHLCMDPREAYQLTHRDSFSHNYRNICN